MGSRRTQKTPDEKDINNIKKWEIILLNGIINFWRLAHNLKIMLPSSLSQEEKKTFHKKKGNAVIRTIILYFFVY